MKNLELYRTIEALVEAKQEKCDPVKPIFAINYCKQQLTKKKLLPYNPRTKMNRIMQNFNQLENYVNIEDLFHYVYKKANEQKKDSSFTVSVTPVQKPREIASVEQRTLKKVKELLGPYNQERYRRENLKLKNIIEQLQKISSLRGAKRKNNHHLLECLDFSQFDQNNDPAKWNYYQGILNDGENEQKQSCREKQTFKSSKQQNQLLHQVTTYLQIILEHQYKKKWARNSNNFVRRTKARKSLQIPKYKKQNFENSFEEQNKSPNFRRTVGAGRNPKKPLKQSEYSPKGNNCGLRESKGKSSHKKLKQTFTFRNRNVKHNIMEKIGKFVDLIECEEKSLKKDKQVCLNEISKLQGKLKVNYSQCVRSSVMADEQDIKILKGIVMKQK